jgi:hypothetical protein
MLDTLEGRNENVAPSAGAAFFELVATPFRRDSSWVGLLLSSIARDLRPRRGPRNL